MSVRPAILDRYYGAIEAALRDALSIETQLGEILRYHIGFADGGAPSSLGKLLRPALVLFIAKGLGGDPDAVMPAAVGLEFVHGFSLIHDDVQDRDEVRRGRPAVWTRWGIPQAINAGDLMQAIAVRQGLEAGPASAAALLAATMEMIEGQSLDLSFEERFVDTEAYLGMVDKKTGALFRCALRLGGLAAEASDEVLDRLDRLGVCIGRAFQIQDDLLGVWGDGDVLGKPTASDIRRRKKAFPVALTHARATTEDRAELERVYAGDAVGADAVEWVVGLMERLGVRGEGEAAVGRYVQEALDLVDAIPLAEDGRDDLKDLIRFLARREK